MREIGVKGNTAWSLLVIVGLLVGSWFVVTTCVDIANSKETTTLDEALDRPVKIERYVDKDNGVVCYWNTRYPGYLTCVKVTNTTQRHAQ